MSKLLRYLLASAALLISVPGWAEECNLKLGVVPQFEQRKLLQIWQPIIDRLEASVSCNLEFVGAENIPDFESKFAEGLYDLAYMNPYHAVVANQKQGYLPVLRSGSRGLQGVLVVRKDSDIQSVSELNGKTLAFPSPNALGASLLMRAELQQLHQVRVNPEYVKTHPSVYLYVAKGLASAGGGIQRTLDEQPEELKSALKVIYTTQEVSSHPLVIHPRVDPDLAERVVEQLLAIAAEAPDLFEAIPMKKPVRTSLQDYDPVAELHLERFAN
ncbi:phosphate/phosphite/phosphonate ABC transporter substrate-binding protein [Marinobacterium lutimaris]|uniref:Phosphonate transport system substrate-binding protein n=1 Tax=Marinobacterium lutimaris TaxID=568106 RepID=A0A1H5X8R3_9GAMM|nr:phosphate/phosphite/phosphonate ABC transporter substrate-binding protein [Marinobacterium lutimaris]SEG08132.1 phosphonate transport system substrate-binding protein [Marinobacterium lutimaris]